MGKMAPEQKAPLTQNANKQTGTVRGRPAYDTDTPSEGVV